MGPGLKIFRWHFAALGDSIVQQRSVAELAVGRFERRASFDKILITLGKGSLVEVVGFVRRSLAGESSIYFLPRR